MESVPYIRNRNWERGSVPASADGPKPRTMVVPGSRETSKKDLGSKLRQPGVGRPQYREITPRNGVGLPVTEPPHTTSVRGAEGGPSRYSHSGGESAPLRNKWRSKADRVKHRLLCLTDSRLEGYRDSNRASRISPNEGPASALFFLITSQSSGPANAGQGENNAETRRKRASTRL